MSLRGRELKITNDDKNIRTKLDDRIRKLGNSAFRNRGQEHLEVWRAEPVHLGMARKSCEADTGVFTSKGVS